MQSFQEQYIFSSFLFYFNSAECSRLPEPLNGRKSCEEFSGRKLCTMTCNEGFAQDTRAITTFGCGPDTEWRWNGMTDVNVPACSSMILSIVIKFGLFYTSTF